MSSPLNADEINALMGAINEGRVPQGSVGTGGTGGARGPVVPYDLTSQDRIIREQMPTLNSMNEHLALSLGNGLSGRTRLSIKCTSQPATLLKFIDFSGSIEPQCALCVLSLGKGFGPALVVMKPGVPEALLAAALGDRKKAAASNGEAKREFTTVDQTVLRRLMSVMTDSMREIWAPILAFQPEVLRFETDVRMAAVAAPTEVAIVSNFDITGSIEGRIQLIIPYPVVEPVKARLSAPTTMASGANKRFAKALERELEQVEVEMRGVLGKTSFRLSQLLSLKVGDVVILQSDESTPLPIYVQGRAKLAGTPRVSCGSMALTIERDLKAGRPPTIKNQGIRETDIRKGA